MWFLGLVVVLLIGAVAVVASGRWGAMSPAYDDRPEVTVPARQALTSTDIESARFGVGLRGYRMDEVDTLLERLAREVAERDRRIADLERAVQPIVYGPEGAEFSSYPGTDGPSFEDTGHQPPILVGGAFPADEPQEPTTEQPTVPGPDLTPEPAGSTTEHTAEQPATGPSDEYTDHEQPAAGPGTQYIEHEPPAAGPSSEYADHAQHPVDGPGDERPAEQYAVGFPVEEPSQPEMMSEPPVQPGPPLQPGPPEPPYQPEPVVEPEPMFEPKPVFEPDQEPSDRPNIQPPPADSRLAAQQLPSEESPRSETVQAQANEYERLQAEALALLGRQPQHPPAPSTDQPPANAAQSQVEPEAPEPLFQAAPEPQPEHLPADPHPVQAEPQHVPGERQVEPGADEAYGGRWRVQVEEEKEPEVEQAPVVQQEAPEVERIAVQQQGPHEGVGYHEGSASPAGWGEPQAAVQQEPAAPAQQPEGPVETQTTVEEGPSQWWPVPDEQSGARGRHSAAPQPNPAPRPN